MHATVPTLDQESFAAFRAGDENALERLFRGHYPPLVLAASSELGDAPRAARVVERAVLSAWHARSEFRTPEALEAFIDKAANEHLGLEKGRIAAVHRFESFERVHAAPAHTTAAPTLEEAWRKVVTALHPEPGAARSRREEAKHHTAEHLQAITRKRSPLPMIVGLVAVAALVWAAFAFLPGVGAEGRLTRALSSPDARTFASQPGQRGTVRLDDGTSVLVAPESRLVIPPGFPADVRGVQLEGAASFTVAPNARLPFVVRAGDATITARGTAFDVSAFTGDTTVLVAVREGEVVLRTPKDKRTIRPGEGAAVAAGGTLVVPTPALVEESFSWVGGQLTVVDRPLREVLPALRRWYGLDLVPADSSMLDRLVSLRAGLDSAGEILRALQTNAAMVVDQKGSRMVLRDLAPAGKKR